MNKSCSPTTFSQIQREHDRGVPGSAPLKELWAYVNLEKNLHTKLEKREYSPSFWSWAHHYLKEDLAAVLGRGDSIAWTIREKICSRLRNTNKDAEQLAKRANLNRQLNRSRFGYTIRDYWHGEAVRVTIRGDLRIHVSADRPALSLPLGKGSLREIRHMGALSSLNSRRKVSR